MATGTSTKLLREKGKWIRSHMLSLRRVLILAVVCAAFAVTPFAESRDKPASTHQSGAASAAKPDNFLSETFASVVPEIKAKSRVPVLLPSELPTPMGNAKCAVIEKSTESEYAISLYYKMGIGDAGFAAFFAGNAKPGYKLQGLENVREVKLSRGIKGFFSEVSCGGSCAPANLWWEESGVLYQIQLKFSSTLPARDQQKAITASANSAILAGPR